MLKIRLDSSSSNLISCIPQTNEQKLCRQLVVQTDKIKIKFDSDFRAGFVLFVLGCAIFGALHPMVPAFYIDRLLHLFFGTEMQVVGDLSLQSSGGVSPETVNPLSLKLSDPSSSEGFRVSLWKEIIEYANDKPITGSGFVGVWSLSKLGIGSSHSDFFDVLFRTGYLGLVSYLALLIFVLIKLLKRNIGLLIVLAAFLIFGIFHEAFKEAHGRTALAFLLGVACAHFNEGATDDHRH